MILVTGGTGLVGSHLLYFLAKENANVRAIHRKNSDLNAVKRIFACYSSSFEKLFNSIEWMEADITDIPALTKAFEGITQVYHCAAFVNFNPAKYPVLKKVNIKGTANIVNLCLHKEITKLCFVSSVASLGSKPNSECVDEETYWNPDERNSVYAISKYGAEMEVWRGTQEGLDAVIVNPGIILGMAPNQDSSGIAISLGSSGIPFYPTGGTGIVDVQDVVKAMILLMNSNSINQRYILVGENISYKKLISEMAVRFDKKPPKRKLSKRFMLLLSGLDWFSSKVFRTKRKLVKDTVRSMFTTTCYTNTKFTDQFNFSFTPTSETLDRIANETKIE